MRSSDAAQIWLVSLGLNSLLGVNNFPDSYK
jgi:hypothetical protein